MISLFRKKVKPHFFEKPLIFNFFDAFFDGRSVILITNRDDIINIQENYRDTVLLFKRMGCMLPAFVVKYC